MPSATIAQNISNELMKKRSDQYRNQIKECEHLSEQFWKCAKKHNKVKECGPEYYHLSKCIEKLNN